MKGYKKIFAMFIVAMLALVVLAACTGDDEPNNETSNNETTPANDENGANGNGEDEREFIELVFLRDHDTSERDAFMDDQFVRQYILERFNIGFREVHYTGDMQEWLMLRLAGGDFPDIINPRQANILQAYADAGALINMGELFAEHAPTVLERHAERLPVWRAMSGMDDGQIWAMTMWEPNLTGTNSGPHLQWLIRSDILEQQGFPEIRDENDIFDIIAQGLIDNPETNGQPTVGFSHPLQAWGTDGLRTLTYTYDMGRLTHTTANHGMVFDFEADEFIDVTTDHAYRNGLEFMNRMWREGLFDRDSITDGWEDFEAKMREGRALAAFFLVWPWDYDFNPALAAAGADFRYVPVTAQLSSQIERGERMIYPQRAGEVWSSVAITTNAQHPERIAELFEWQASDEGMIMMGWGREGYEFEIVDGRRVATEYFFERSENDPNYPHNIMFGPSEFGFFLGVDDNGQSFRITHDPDVVARTIDPIVRNAWQQMGWDNSFEMYNNNFFDFDETTYHIGLKRSMPSFSSNQMRDWERMNTATHDFTMRLVTASSDEDFDSIFEELLESRRNLGILDFLELWNAEYRELSGN